MSDKQITSDAIHESKATEEIVVLEVCKSEPVILPNAKQIQYECLHQLFRH